MELKSCKVLEKTGTVVLRSDKGEEIEVDWRTGI